ncbi:class I SAM-dependent methyltransferase [Octadecabacter sp. G9-8]|uniref:Class I SAM-dependent methyltransferase n=1 Tax=Octadecabacter dasysiphoniae TaxID=2909341 RepID=A0ABS9CZE5_9RHOB|nr:methyltransferase domain-containing protein [Octadecabacter dasysiphoniae]MCF2871443.1 class I SAM-dependent methyltransferase [Octadecabacter dasysiphoniae]
MIDPHKSYDDEFYDRQMSGSYDSAARISEHLAQYYRPKTVVDIGCGRGTWLKAFRDTGAEITVGFDGPWNSQSDMIDPNVKYHQADLNKPLTLQHKQFFDLAISLEVAEHLLPACSSDFIAKLTQFSDVVLFSAAYLGQDGRDHINEREHSFWAELFIERGYVPYDLFRPVFWGDSDVRFWYQQNCFLYVKSGSDLCRVLAENGVYPIKNLSFMNCVHPRLFKRYTKPRGLKRIFWKIRKMTGRG